ncbi:boophilin-G2-like [Episyrphus balteatus]|uniref:boophilin-G2-like n=1 Tax=Episyrphus balteatus TaxID=286459 RepID=UPI0024856763|nr:boophilin-G2-like [Episyrphus balteatus]
MNIFNTIGAEKLEACIQEHSRNGNGRIACKAAIPSWSYDSENGKCVKFNYGGCYGNDNRFKSKDECEATCLTVALARDCRSRPDKGPCNGRITAWAYNPRSKSCDKFYYGGCGGNQNRYKSKSICEQICKR